MKFLQTYKTFEDKSEDKTLKKIHKFFKDDFFIKKSMELSPKLSIWIINQFKDKIKDNFKNEDEYKTYLKTGSTKGLQLKTTLLQTWNELSPKIQSIIDWSQSFDITPEEKNNLTKLSFEDSYKKSEEWHDSLKAGGVIEDEHGKVIMTFPDGFYWIDLETTTDRDEADAMGHCGNTNKGDTLYSLRDRNKSPHVTASIDTNNGIVYQMKGRNNKKPIDKYHKYIVALLINDEIDPILKGFGAEYDKSNDFNPSEDLDGELLEQLKEKRPDIDIPVHTPEDIDQMFDDMIDSYYMQEDEYGFRLVSWVKDVCGYDTVIDCLETRSNRLLQILSEIYPDKLDTLNDKQNDKLLNFASTYIDSGDIAKKYNVDLTQKKSATDKWDELIGYIGYDELESIIKDYGYWDKFIYEENYNHEEFVTYPYHWDSKVPKYDYESILNIFFGYDDVNSFNQLSKIFDGSEDKHIKKYYEEIWDVWDKYDLQSELSSKLTNKQKEEELDQNDWYEYTGNY